MCDTKMGGGGGGLGGIGKALTQGWACEDAFLYVCGAKCILNLVMPIARAL